MKSRPVGAFPQLVNSVLEEAASPSGVKGWFEKVKQARENKQRIGKQDTLMKHYGLVYPSLTPSCEIPPPGWWSAMGTRRQTVEYRRQDMIISDRVVEIHDRAELRWSNGAKHIQSRLPRGGWEGIRDRCYHLFEYRGFCGWICQGHIPFHRQWIFRCECRCCTGVLPKVASVCTLENSPSYSPSLI
jgi:hypothetical protein